MLSTWARVHSTLRWQGASKAILYQAINSIALPSLLWGLEAFPINTNVILKVHSAFLSVIRAIFKIPYCPNHEVWIGVRSHINSLFRTEKLRAPAIELYHRQEKLYLFLQKRPQFDLHNIMSWRNLSWLQSLSRKARPSRKLTGTPPRQLEQELQGRTKFSCRFRALMYAERHCVAPFN